jgi:hypothetical protein
MKGYVENIGKAPIYILKGVVGKGDKIGFDVLLERFGSEADTSSAAAFASWLSRDRFMDTSKWKIVVEKESAKPKQEQPKIEPKIEPKKEDKPISKVTATNREIITKAVGGVFKEMTIDDIINMKISDLRQLERIKDEKLLRAALKKAERMDKKTMLCNKIRDRLLEFDLR